MKQVFKSVNYIERCGDTYARWTQEGKRKINDAVEMTVTDSNGVALYYTIVRKGGFRRTLADCKYACQANFRCYGPK